MRRVSLPNKQSAARNSRPRGALRLCLLLMCAIALPVAAAPSKAAVSLTCNGVSLQVSVELYYRFPSDGGLGTIRAPDLRLTHELQNCSLEELYQQLAIHSEIVLHHATGERPATALTQTEDTADWRRVSDFRAVTLQDGMRVWITLFNTPGLKTSQKEV